MWFRSAGYDFRHWMLVLLLASFTWVGVGGIRNVPLAGSAEEKNSPVLTRLFEEVIHPRVSHGQVVQARLERKLHQVEFAVTQPGQGFRQAAAKDPLHHQPAPRAPPPARAPPFAVV